MRKLLSIRDVRIFLAGWTLSQFGDWAMIIVLAVWAKDLTGSNAAAGLTFFALSAPSLFSPLAGLLVDRVRRRPLLIAVYTLEAIAVLSLLFVHDRSDVWLLYAMAVFYGAAGTIGASARSALMTVTIPKDLLGDGNAIFQSVREGLRLIAPLIGAGIYAATGGGVVAVLDSVSFVAVVISLLLMRTPEPRFERVEHSFVTEALAGARHIWHTIPLRQIIFSTGAALLVVGFSETIIFAVIDEGLHREPSFLGVLSTLQGVGAIAGGVTAARGLKVFGDVRVAGIGMAAFAVGDFSFISANLPLIAVGIPIAGFGVSWLIVGLMTAVQVRTPLRLQGRVSSAADLLISTPQTVSIALGAALIAIVDYRLLVVVEAVAVASCGMYLVTRRAIVPAETPQVASAELLSQPQP
jgi:Na+/melibiose symporter-like transporter